LSDSMQGLEINAVYKAFDGDPALQGVTFSVERGQIMALLGPSGSGKSTLLNIIAGIEEPDRGDVLWDGSSVLEVPVHAREFGFMFQDYMLFPHMNVFENVAFGLHMKGTNEVEIKNRVQTMLELVGLPGFEERDVITLSGGEQQRIALARALAPQPRLLLLDEPLGALDRLLRERLALDLRGILRQMQQTALYVTHDQEEAFVIAEQVVLLHDGQVAQQGTPRELYEHPHSEFAARFLGLDNILQGELTRRDGSLLLETALGSWQIPESLGKPAGPQGPAVKILLRPDAVRLGASGPCQIQGTLLERTFRGDLQWVQINAAGQRLSFNVPSRDELPGVGEAVEICFDPVQALQLLQP
jgi:ABC-type Fe3+/spermidine/putrescine transport system ATPase subunit